MNPPPPLALGFVDEMAQASAVFGGSDFARDAGVIERRHVDEIAAGKSDVAGDARAFFAERLFGDLDDDLLALLQHVGNELRCGAAACDGHGCGLPVAVLRAAATVGTSAAIVTASAVASSATRGVLHARAVIVLDAGVPGLLFLWRLIFGRGRIAVSG